MNLYPPLLQYGLLPLFDALGRRRLWSHWRDAQQAQWWDPGRIRDAQWLNTTRLLRIALETVPYYKKKYAGIHLQDIRSWDDFRKLPPLTRTEINEHREELRSSLIGRAMCRIHATGGSSGQPLRFLLTLDSYDRRTAMTWRTYSWSGYSLGQRIAYLWGAPVGQPSRKAVLKSSLHKWFYSQRIVPTFARTERLWEETWRSLSRWRPTALVGYVSSLTGFARYLIETERKLPSVRRVITAAEPCEPAQRELIQNGLLAPVFVTYGSREFMSIAGECEQRQGLHTAAENLLVETESSQADQPGEILVTDFHNLGTVFLRYRIGDTGTLTAATCSCGRGLPIIKTLQGRSGATVDFPDGRQLTGILFRHVLKDVPEVAEFQAVQEAPDLLVVNLVLTQPLSERSEGLIRTEFGKYLGPNRLELRPVKHTRLGPNGKAPAIVPYERLHQLLD